MLGGKGGRNDNGIINDQMKLLLFYGCSEANKRDARSNNDGKILAV
jgi:hypothetical protein